MCLKGVHCLLLKGSAHWLLNSGKNSHTLEATLQGLNGCGFRVYFGLGFGGQSLGTGLKMPETSKTTPTPTHTHTCPIGGPSP